MIVGVVMYIRVIRVRSGALAYACLLVFTIADLWITTARHIHLELVPVVNTLPMANTGDPNVRIAGAPEFPTIHTIDLRYSPLTSVAIDNKWTSVFTHEGSVEPISIRNLHLGLLHNEIPALEAAACNWLWDGSKWRELSGALPRARFIPSEFASLCAIPLRRLTKENLKQLREASSPCRIVSDVRGRLNLYVDAHTEGIVVIADTYYPGWTCRSERTNFNIEPVHHAFQGIRVPPGEHSLELVFQPASVSIGCVLTLIGCLGGVAILLCSRQRGRSKFTRQPPDEVSP
jgi:hypothetical protein